MNLLGQTLEALANATNNNTSALDKCGDSILNIIKITDALTKRVEELEAKVKELENPQGGSGAGHYGGGPWG